MITAIVVARGGSVRLPGKALLPFGDSTMLGHKVDTLRKCKRIDRVVVGSDSREILNEAASHGAEVVHRDDYHCDETSCSANEMIADMVSKVDGADDDVFVWAHPTNPLVLPETYDRAIEVYEQAGGFDSLVSVYEVRRHAWCDGRPDNFDLQAAMVRHPLAKDLDAYQFQNGAIFIQTRARWVETAYFFGVKPLLFAMSAVESVDVDTAGDLDLATAIWVSSAAQTFAFGKLA